ncbi:FecR family protein [Flavobacteriaceae bacterium F08102]|nr:FecR family protein [Flavobacteriaceae bacterium F08102]
MTQKEFLELVDKFEQGLCSEKEQALLYEFCEKSQFKNLASSWNLFEENRTRIKLLKRTLETINEESARKATWSSFNSIGSAAAILIAISLGYYFYIIRGSESINTLATNAITLAFSDGTTTIIKENDTCSLYNAKGSVIGVQYGNKIVFNDYNKDAETKLVYNTLTVPYGKQFELEFVDGTRAYLNSGTSIRYPEKFLKKSERKIFVTGEVFLNVYKDLSRPFIVNVNNLNVRVLGTSFNINAYPEDTKAEVVLVEGSVALYNEGDSNDIPTLLTPGYKAIFNKENAIISTEQVRTSMYTSWMKGELVFRNMTFENIVKKLERHYDVKIISQKSDINKTIFNASFGNESLDVILRSLKRSYGINYSIKDNVIVIY